MKFKKELYHYQNDILNVFDKEIARGDKKIHIVAPPGSGKTIVGLEMVSRLNNNTLILVPNLTLQEQWKDKLGKLFLESGEDIENLVSFDPNIIKKINIITYQSLTQTGEENDFVNNKIFDNWFKDFKEEFETRELFDSYINSLKESNITEYSELFSKYKKGLKSDSQDETIDNLLSEKVKNFFAKLKENNIQTIVVDEAHHLTSWWSRVIFYLYKFLGSPFIIGLTATPPFDDVDFFDLNDEYSDLLGEVDYYIPTPAIIKSGRLAPYNDLVYFVEPDKNLKNLLLEKETILNEFIEKENKKISKTIFEVIEKDYEKLEKNSGELLDSFLRFIYFYDKTIDISNYINENSVIKPNLEDIAKATGKWLTKEKISQKGKNNGIEEDYIKRMFFDLGYIWRANNFYKFQTPIEKLLIYSKTKINGVKEILNKEKLNLGENLKCAIITDFLSQESDYINCEYIFDNLIEEFKSLNPYLVSGQGIWKIGENGLREKVDNETILSVTKKLETGETKLLIGTRGILGEGWDCPKLNTLIDLTGVVAYMSVNQVRGRAIRLDLDNLKKCSNIYDIVCLGEGLQGLRDYKRLEGKHEKFYGVNDAKIVVKGVDHIYPNLSAHLNKYLEINKNMILRSQYRDLIYDYWGIGGEYLNKEIFGLHLELNSSFEIFPYVNTSIFSGYSLFKMFKSQIKLKELENSYYFTLIYNFLFDFITKITKTLKDNRIIPEDFSFELKKDNKKGFQIISKYKDEMVSKGYITYMANIFSTITNQKYVLSMYGSCLNNNLLEETRIIFPLPDVLSKNKEYRENFLDYLSKEKNEKMKKNKKTLIYYVEKSPVIFVFGMIWTVFIGLIFSNINISISLSLKIFLLILPLLLLLIFSIYIFLVRILLKLIKFIGYISDFFRPFLSNFNPFQYYFLANKTRLRKDFDFIFLNSIDVDKKDYIGKTPFINSKIEKLWI